MKNLLAQNPVDFNAIQNNGEPGANFVPSTTIGDVISKALPWIFAISGMALLIYIVFGGIQLMLSQGDPKNAATAKAHITNALVGFIIIFVAYWAVQLVGRILGLQGITTIFR